MKIHFTKMHGLGNDYIYINCMAGEPKYPELLALAMSDIVAAACAAMRYLRCVRLRCSRCAKLRSAAGS